jgi:hypothetical protein
LFSEKDEDADDGVDVTEELVDSGGVVVAKF